jgi:hypothetical protein
LVSETPVVLAVRPFDKTVEAYGKAQNYFSHGGRVFDFQISRQQNYAQFFAIRISKPNLANQGCGCDLFPNCIAKIKMLLNFKKNGNTHSFIFRFADIKSNFTFEKNTVYLLIKKN